MPDDRASIIEKIKKLLALANHPGTNENEAALAASRVQDILAAHNLDMSSLDGAEASRQDRTKGGHLRSAMYKYQQTLMKTLAENNFCVYWLNKQEKKDPTSRKGWRTVLVHMLVGRTVNVTVTKSTYDYLVDTMDRLLPYVGMQKRGKEALAWLDGCTERLCERLTERRKQAEAEGQRRKAEDEARRRHPGAANTANALVVLTDVYGSEADLNNDFVRGWEPGTTAANRRKAEMERAERAAKQKVLYEEGLAKGLNHEQATWYSYGWSMAESKEHARNTERPETEAQQRKREERDSRWYAKYSSQQQRRRYKKDQRRSDPNFRAGAQAANEIGLDDQVNSRKTGRIES